jgi:O-antigen/teichoic acid export membrane protein
MLRFGASGLLGYVSPTETFRADQLLVGLVLSARELGLYVAALALCNLPRFLAQGLGLVAYSTIAAVSDEATKRRLLWKYTALGGGVAGCVAVPLIVFAHPLLDLAFGHEFASAARTAQILLVGTAVLCGRRLLADGLRGAGAPWAGSVAEGLSWFWLVPAAVLLVPAMGLEGVAISLASSYVVTTLVLVRVAERRDLGIPRGRQAVPGPS